jgi:ElaB/YqjD/DUF883 family membrane-anchored ribosome-binding protein
MATNGSKDVAEMAQGARETMRQMQGRMSERFEDVRGYAESVDATIREFAREKPMVAIACAIGIGFLIGRLASRA